MTEHLHTLDDIAPAWEANYQPGNVSDYLIGYANTEAAAKGAALAWLQSQSDADPTTLEWVEQPTGDQHDHWYDLIQNADDGMVFDLGINVRHRLPATTRDAARQATPARTTGHQPGTRCGHLLAGHTPGTWTDCNLPDSHDGPHTAPQTTGQDDTDCPSCEARIEHTEHCPTPETHNWGCGCPTDQHPAVGQPTEAHDTEARPPRVQWRVEGYDADEWNPLGSYSRDHRDARQRQAQAQLRYPDMPTRVVRETTTWTVEDER